MHRLEREVSRVLDMATAHRLEADLKERDLVNARAELVADEEDFVDIERRLAGERELIQDLERRHAEAGAALRAAQHALKLEAKRRASAEEVARRGDRACRPAPAGADGAPLENDTLRARLGEQPAPGPLRARGREAAPRRRSQRRDRRRAETSRRNRPAGAWCRCRHGLARSPPSRRSSRLPSLRRQRATFSGSPAKPRGGGKEVWRASAAADAAHACRGSARPAISASWSRSAWRRSDGAATASRSRPGGKANPESRFFEALAEIRALKRAANQAGE